MKYFLVIFALIFVGCSEYPVTKINCIVGVENIPYANKFEQSYVFIDPDLFQDAQIEIYGTFPDTYKCGAYLQNNSSIQCQFSTNASINIEYNKLAKTIRHEFDLEDNKTRVALVGSCGDA